MEPISLILLGISLLAGAGSAAAIYVACLTLPSVLSWFRQRRFQLSGRNNIARTVVDRLANGQYRTVQGVFNTGTGNWVESRTITSDRLDQGMAARHRSRRIAVHTI